jgi:hypothetical protein
MMLFKDPRHRGKGTTIKDKTFEVCITMFLESKNSVKVRPLYQDTKWYEVRTTNCCLWTWPKSLGTVHHNNHRIYIYLGLGSYRLTIKERNGGVGIRGKNRVVDESTSCVANMSCEGFYDGETKLL